MDLATIRSAAASVNGQSITSLSLVILPSCHDKIHRFSCAPPLLLAIINLICLQEAVHIDNQIDVHEALKSKDLIFVDVRSPQEHRKEKIPGSLNIPLFSDEEQKELGTTYKHAGHLEARQKGLEYAAPKLARLASMLGEVASRKTPVLYCRRGGLRSRSLSQILSLVGIPALRLKGGYKAYRQFIFQSLGNYHLHPRPVLLHGLTGTGKTPIIQTLITSGYAALDLEGMACHRGSVFGKIGFTTERSQKDFEALLWNQLEKHGRSRYLVIEKEGRRIGRLVLPDFLVQSMEEGMHILLEAPLETRAERIVSEYIDGPLSESEKEEFTHAITSLVPRLGRKTAEKVLSLFETGDYRQVALILCRDYYDRFYTDARPDRYPYAAVFDSSSIPVATEQVIAFLENNKLIERRKEVKT